LRKAPQHDWRRRWQRVSSLPPSIILVQAMMA
jgi:hypothetical protein